MTHKQLKIIITILIFTKKESIKDFRAVDWLLWRKEGFRFTPVAVETSGMWGKEEGLKLIKSTGTRISEVTNDRRASSFFLRRMSVTLQRGNVVYLLGRNKMRYSTSNFPITQVFLA